MRFMAGASFSYVLPSLGIPGAFQLNGTLSYVQAPYNDINNTQRGDNRTLILAGADYTSADGHWNVSVVAKNLLNKDYVLTRTSTPSLGIETQSYWPPRTILATVRYKL